MVESHTPLDRTFAALADPTRRAILARLRDGPATVGQVAEPFAMSLNGISKHVLVLERAGLVAREVRGREHRLHLRAKPLRAASEWTRHYQQFWSGRIDALERFVTQRAKKTARRSHKES